MQRKVKFGAYKRRDDPSKMVAVTQRGISCMSAPDTCWTKAVLFHRFNEPNSTQMMAESVFLSHYTFAGRYITNVERTEILTEKYVPPKRT